MANRLVTYGLLNMEEARTACGVNANDDKNDLLILYVNAVTDYIERYTGRKFLSRTYTEVFDGDDTTGHILDNGLNMSALTSITIVDVNDVSTVIPAASRKWSTSGELYLEDGYAFTSGFQNCTVVYVAGSTLAPAAVKAAALILLKELWEKADSQGGSMTSMSVEGQSMAFTQNDMPAEAAALLNAYQRPRFA